LPGMWRGVCQTNNITVGSYKPRFVLKAAFHSSPSFIWMLLYPHLMSSFVKIFQPFNLSTSSPSKVVGIGFWSLCHWPCDSLELVWVSHLSSLWRRMVMPLGIGSADASCTEVLMEEFFRATCSDSSEVDLAVSYEFDCMVHGCHSGNVSKSVFSNTSQYSW